MTAIRPRSAAATSSERLLERNRALRGLLRARGARAWPKPAARCPSASCAAAGCWPSAAAPTPPTRSTSRWNSCIPSSSASARCRRSTCPLLFGPWLDAILRPEDIVMGFGPPEGDSGGRGRARDARAARRHDVRAAGRRGRLRCRRRRPRDPFIHQELIEILYHTLWETVHVFFEHRELGHDVGRRRLPLSVPRAARSRTRGDLVAEVAASIRMKVADDARLRDAGGARAKPDAHRRGVARHRRAPRARRQADPLRQRRLGHRRQRLGDRLRRCRRRAIAPIPAISLSLEPANITAIANDVGTDVDLPPPAHRAGAARGRGHRHLHQRRIAQHHRGAGRGAQARAADRRAARLRRRRDRAARPGRLRHRGALATTSRAFRKCRRPSIT